MSDGLSKGARIGAIVGGVLCGILLVAILVLIFVICYKRRKRASQQDDYNSAVNVTRYDASINDAQKSPQDPKRAQLHIHQYARNAVHLNPSPHSNGRRTPSGREFSSPNAVEMRQHNSSQHSTPTHPRQAYSAPQAGIENPVFFAENHSGSIDTSLSRAERRRNRMDHLSAAAIAAERDRNTSVFNITDTESNADDTESVIVFDHRTAL